MDALKQFWIERAPRERLALGIGGVMLAGVLLYLMLRTLIKRAVTIAAIELTVNI